MPSPSSGFKAQAVRWSGLVCLFNAAVGMVLLATYLMPLDCSKVVELSTHVHLAMAAVTYLILRFVMVPPFGRHSEVAGKLCVTVPAPLSWFFQECPTLLNIIYYVLLERPARSLRCGGRTLQQMLLADPLGYVTAEVTPAVCKRHLGLLLFAIHYTHRSLLYPRRVHKGTPVPMQITLSAMLYCAFNGRQQLLANVVDMELVGEPAGWTRQGMLILIGCVFFFVGMFINIRSDWYLTKMKEAYPPKVYKVPYGGLFEFVTCPNFFGEIVEWIGYAVVVYATRGPVAGCAAFSFAVYVVANLLPRAWAHHTWYLQRFGDTYEALNRRAVIPFAY